MMRKIIFRDGDTLDILGKPIRLEIGTFEELDIPWFCEPGMCVDGERIVIRTDMDDPQETFIHELCEMVKYTLLKELQKAVDDFIHDERG